MPPPCCKGAKLSSSGPETDAAFGCCKKGKPGLFAPIPGSAEFPRIAKLLFYMGPARRNRDFLHQSQEACSVVPFDDCSRFSSENRLPSGPSWDIPRTATAAHGASLMPPSGAVRRWQMTRSSPMTPLRCDAKARRVRCKPAILDKCIKHIKQFLLRCTSEGVGEAMIETGQMNPAVRLAGPLGDVLSKGALQLVGFREWRFHAELPFFC